MIASCIFSTDHINISHRSYPFDGDGGAGEKKERKTKVEVVG